MHSPAQQEQAEASKTQIAAQLGKSVAPEIVSAGSFYKAEAYRVPARHDRISPGPPARGAHHDPALAATGRPRIGMGVLFAAALTTLGGVWSAMAAMVAADFGWAAGRRVPLQRGLITGFAVVSWLGAVFLVDDILNRLILANVPVAGLAFALLPGFTGPARRRPQPGPGDCGDRVGDGRLPGAR